MLWRVVQLQESPWNQPASEKKNISLNINRISFHIWTFFISCVIQASSVNASYPKNLYYLHLKTIWLKTWPLFKSLYIVCKVILIQCHLIWRDESDKSAKIHISKKAGKFQAICDHQKFLFLLYEFLVVVHFWDICMNKWYVFSRDSRVLR